MVNRIIWIYIMAISLSWADPAWQWHDSAGRWPIYPSGSEIAVFGKGANPAAQKALAGASLEGEYGQTQIWRLPQNQKPLSMKGNASFPWSPVFYEFPDQGGRKMALAGGVIVTFRADLSHDKIAAFLEERGLDYMGPLHLQSNTYKVESPAGLASLELANRLHTDDRVEFATPNWWIEVAPR